MWTVAILFHPTASPQWSANSVGPSVIGPLLLQLLAILLDVWLLFRLKGAPQFYVGFALGRSLLRWYFQHFWSISMWSLTYWWGEMLGYLVIAFVVTELAHELLPKHPNTERFYAVMALLLVGVIILNVRLPLTYSGLMLTRKASYLLIAFMGIVVVALCRDWKHRPTWMLIGIGVSLGVQLVAGLLEAKWGPTHPISYLHQSAFLMLQGCWLTATRCLLTA